MTKPIEPYALIRAWGLNMGSLGHYIDDQQAKAKRAGAPQTAIYCRAADAGGAQMLRGDRPTWTDPATGDVWAMWDEQMPADTVTAVEGAARRMGTTLTAILDAAGYDPYGIFEGPVVRTDERKW